MPIRGYSRVGGPAVFHAEGPDTTSAPQTVTLPALAELTEGYAVRVYDPEENAGTNGITVEAHGDDGGATVATIAEDGGEAWLVVVSGVWSQRGLWPDPSLPTEYASFSALAGAYTANHRWAFAPGAELTDTGVDGGLDLTASGASWEAATVPGALGQYAFSGGDYDRLVSPSTDLGTDRTYRIDLIVDAEDYTPTTFQAFVQLGDPTVAPFMWAGTDSNPLSLGRCIQVFIGSGVYHRNRRDADAYLYLSLGYDHTTATRYLVTYQNGGVGTTYFSDRQASGTTASGVVRFGGSDPSPGTWYGRQMRLGGAAFYRGEAYPSDAYLASVRALLAA